MSHFIAHQGDLLTTAEDGLASLNEGVEPRTITLVSKEQSE
jgi:hypothetical protein